MIHIINQEVNDTYLQRKNVIFMRITVVDKILCRYIIENQLQDGTPYYTK